MVQITSSFTLLYALGTLAGVRAACIGPPVNQATLSLVEEFEGFRADVCKSPSIILLKSRAALTIHLDIDATGNPTVGYGHLCKQSGCSDVPYPIPLSEADGQKLLQDDIKIAQQCITLETTSEVVLNANQYGALVSWAFNVGCGASGDSTLIRRLNDGEDANTVASEELPKWNKGNGQPIAGLTRRRAAEVDLFKTPTDVGALPVGC